MSARTAVLDAPALPQVNLLPSDVREARTLGVVKRRLIASVGVTVLAVGTVAAVAQLRVQDAAAQLAQADAETAAMLAEQRPFTEVTTLRAELETARAARAYAMAPEILWSDYVGAIGVVTPAGVKIHSLDYTGATPLGGAAASSDPSVATGVGAISFTAQAAELPDMAQWADALDLVPGLDGVRVTSAILTEDDEVRYELTGTIQVHDSALAHRFDIQPEGDS